MLVLGVDPGYATVGFGVIRHQNGGFSVVEYGTVKTAPGSSLAMRLAEIYGDMTAIIEKHRPDAVAVEELFFNTNVKTAIEVGHARGVILLAAANCGYVPFEYTPLQVKQAIVGYGRAEKRQVMEMTRALLGMKHTPKQDDAADALAIAICHAHSAASIFPG